MTGHATSTKVLTLNIRHGGGKRAKQLIDILVKSVADVVVLTEYKENANSVLIKQSLQELGYKWQTSSSADSKKNAVFIGAKIPFVTQNPPIDFGSHRERMTFAQFADFNLLGVYFPQKEAKRAVFEFITTNAPRLLGNAGIVIGDFNTGRHLLDEEGKTFFCADCLDRLEEIGLVDSWRTRNPDTREFSWYSNAKNGFRIDHAFCTALLDGRVSSIVYDHAPRESGATDHSALTVEFV